MLANGVFCLSNNESMPLSSKSFLISFPVRSFRTLSSATTSSSAEERRRGTVSFAACPQFHHLASIKRAKEKAEVFNRLLPMAWRRKKNPVRALRRVVSSECATGPFAQTSDACAIRVIHNSTVPWEYAEYRRVSVPLSEELSSEYVLK